MQKQLQFLVNDNKKSSFLNEILETLGVEKGPGWPDRFGMNLYLNKKKKKTIRTLSLFTGCGGLDIGFHDAGFDIVEMVEIENKFVETLKKNTGEGKYLGCAKPICIDIRKYDPSFNHQIDFIIGGPPCQTFSSAGRRAAGVMGTDDPRGVLFQEYVRILTKLKPKAFLFENVYGIIGAQGGRPWGLIKQSFENAGYKLFYRILDAADYGVPQHRERLIIVGTKNLTQPFYFPEPITGPDSSENKYYTAGEALSNLTIDGSVPIELNGRYGKLLNEIPPGLNYSYYTKEMGHPNPIFGWRSKFSDFLYKADPHKPVRAIKAQGGQFTGPFSWENRPFTTSELKRLQTIPDNYNLVGGRSVCIHQIGNSVPSQFARILGFSVLDQVFQVAIPFRMRYLAQDAKLGFRTRKRSLTNEYRKKANDCIVKNKITKNPATRLLEKGTRSITLTKNFMIRTGEFKTQMSRFEELTCKINYKLSTDEWLFSTGIHLKRAVIIISPIHGTWTLPTKRVVFQLFEEDEQMLTALWKFFEQKVTSIAGYADLVQLAGYYQYQSKIKIDSMFDNNDDPLWSTLKKIFEGLITGKEMHIKDWTEILNLTAENVQKIMLRLKILGYEVRNSNTNPQIQEGCFLIPYCFPTLTPYSVQLNKNL